MSGDNEKQKKNWQATPVSQKKEQPWHIVKADVELTKNSGQMLKSKKQKLQQEETQDKLVQTLSGKAAQKLPLNGTGGKPLKSQEEEAKRWKEYFSAVRLIVRTNNHS